MSRWLVVALVLLGCGRDRARPPEGRATADCLDVGETLASVDLGNYAEPEERAPVVAKYQAACEKARVSKDEAACLHEARDRWSAGQCVPRMFPEVASESREDCKAVMTRLDGTLRAQLDNPQRQPWIATTLSVMQQSCEEDAWPASLKQCILAAEPAPGVDAMQSCNQQMPPGLQAKLQARLAAAHRAAR